MPEAPRTPRRALSPKLQLMIVAAAAVAALILLLTGRLAGLPILGSAHPPAPQKENSPPGSFRPSKEEWKGLKFKAVKLARFTPEVAAEGRIATDEDLTTPVFSPYSGRVLKVLAQLGDFVKKGSPLLEIDGSELVKGQERLVAAASKVKTAEAEYKLARLSEKREHALYLAKGAAEKDWQQSKAKIVQARDALESTEIALSSARQNLRILGNTPGEIARMEAASPKNADPIAWVRSPIAGTVIARNVGLGENIRSGGSHPLLQIGNLSKVWLVAEVRESDAPSVRLGEPVEVRVLAYPGRVFHAAIAWVSPVIDQGSHRLPVRAEVANKEGALKPGMFADFTIVTGKPVAVPAVPAEAVVYHGKKAQVWVAGKGKTLGLRQIEVGRSEGGLVEVRSGLSPGEVVVTSGALFIDRAARGG